MHWADSASLSLLHYVSHGLAAERVLIIATFRSEDLNARADGQSHQLVETMRLMRRDDLLEEISLSNLSQANVVKLAQFIVGGNLHPDFGKKLATESQGNPLYIVESMRMLVEYKQLIQQQGLFRLAATEIEIPVKVKDIILRRLSSLKFDQRRMLDMASVIGEKFSPELPFASILAFLVAATATGTIAFKRIESAHEKSSILTN